MWLSHSWIIITIALVFNLLECHGYGPQQVYLQSSNAYRSGKLAEIYKKVENLAEKIDEAGESQERSNYPVVRLIRLEEIKRRTYRFAYLPSTFLNKDVSSVNKDVSQTFGKAIEGFELVPTYNDQVVLRLKTVDSSLKDDQDANKSKYYFVKVHRPVMEYIKWIQHICNTAYGGYMRYFDYIRLVPYIAAVKIERGGHPIKLGPGLFHKLITKNHIWYFGKDQNWVKENWQEVDRIDPVTRDDWLKIGMPQLKDEQAAFEVLQNTQIAPSDSNADVQALGLYLTSKERYDEVLKQLTSWLHLFRKKLSRSHPKKFDSPVRSYTKAYTNKAFVPDEDTSDRNTEDGDMTPNPKP